jgi:hypothetical protein
MAASCEDKGKIRHEEAVPSKAIVMIPSATRNPIVDGEVHPRKSEEQIGRAHVSSGRCNERELYTGISGRAGSPGCHRVVIDDNSQKLYRGGFVRDRTVSSVQSARSVLRGNGNMHGNHWERRIVWRFRARKGAREDQIRSQKSCNIMPLAGSHSVVSSSGYLAWASGTPAYVLLPARLSRTIYRVASRCGG